MPYAPPSLFAHPPLPPAVAVERWRILAFGGQGFAPLSGWLLPGYELCSALAAREAAELGGSAAPLDLRLQSSRTYQISGSSARAGQWFSFLNCGQIQPWKSAFNSFGHVGGGHIGGTQVGARFSGATSPRSLGAGERFTSSGGLGVAAQSPVPQTNVYPTCIVEVWDGSQWVARANITFGNQAEALKEECWVLSQLGLSPRDQYRLVCNGAPGPAKTVGDTACSPGVYPPKPTYPAYYRNLNWQGF